MSEEEVVFLGMSGKSPALMMWADPTRTTSPKLVAEMRHGYSVYALAISPDGSRVALGTRTGLLQVHNLVNYRAVSNSAPVLDMYHHQTGVTSLDFCTSDLLASGGLDGKIKIWSIPETKVVAELDAHPGGVIALCRIGSLLLASLGRDSTLRIWDLDSLKCRFVKEDLSLPHIQALTSLTYDRNSGFLAHSSNNGNLHIYDVAREFAMNTVPAHEGDFCAIAGGPHRFATAGLSDSRLKVWDADLKNVQMETDTGPGIVSLTWIGDESLVAVGKDGSARAWLLKDGLIPGPYLPKANVRTCAGLPTGLLVGIGIKASRQWRDSRVAEAKECMDSTDPESERRFTNIVEELYSKGFSAEASVLIADSARAHDRQLWELESRLSLLRSLGEGQDSLPSMHAVGHLLSRIREPELALTYFQKIHQIDPNYSDTEQMISDLQYHPLIGLSPAKSIRGDFSQPEHVTQEIKKHSILEKPFQWPVLFNSQKGHALRDNLEVIAIRDEVRAEIERNLPGTHEVTSNDSKLYRRNEVLKTDWVLVTKSHSQLPIAYALEVRSADLVCEVTPHILFDTKLLNIDEATSWMKHNEAVTRAWKAVQNSSTIQAWLTDINSLVFNAVRQLGNRQSAIKDTGMF